MRPQVTAWYEQLRSKYRPNSIEILLVAESPPNPGSSQRRFFCSPALLIDNLYRAVALAMYGQDPDFRVDAKESVLRRFADDGLWLVDAVDVPINQLSTAERHRAIKESIPSLVSKCRNAQPRRGIIICHGGVFELTGSALRAAGLRVLHEQPLPFPLGNWRERFVTRFRECISHGASGAFVSAR